MTLRAAIRENGSAEMQTSLLGADGMLTIQEEVESIKKTIQRN
jgi:hypothetical protein